MFDARGCRGGIPWLWWSMTLIIILGLLLAIVLLMRAVYLRSYAKQAEAAH